MQVRRGGGGRRGELMRSHFPPPTEKQNGHPPVAVRPLPYRALSRKQRMPTNTLGPIIINWAEIMTWAIMLFYDRAYINKLYYVSFNF